jgi:NAD(P)-dependent dehydrogenase (short-subunit alcohol dehydrogenase family)
MSFTNKLAGKKVVIVGGSSGYSTSPLFIVNGRIGFGVAEAVASLGSKVIIVSSSPEKVSNALTRLKTAFPKANIEGHAVSVTDTEKFVDLLKGFGEIDHLVYSAVDLLVRGPVEEVDLVKAKEGFDIKFWGAVTSVTGRPFPYDADCSCRKT